jgi:amino acid adenylation domain-containing protein
MTHENSEQTRAKAYWHEHMQGASVTQVPGDHERSGASVGSRSRRAVVIGAQTASMLTRLGERENATVGHVLAAALAILVARYSREDDVVIGMPARTPRQLWPLRLELRRGLSVRELIGRVRAAADEAASHDLPLREIAASGADGESDSRLFAVSVTDAGSTHDDLDLSLSFDLRAADLAPALDYDAALFDAASMERFGAHLSHLLEAMVADPDAPARSCRLLDAPERERLLDVSAGARIDYAFTPADELVRSRACVRPDHHAIEQQGRVVTYGELVERANRLAHWLERRVPGRNALIGVFLDRSPELVVAELAIWTAGHAYVPLAEPMPPGRAAWVLGESGAQLVLCSKNHAQALEGAGCDVIVLESLAEELAKEPTEPPPRSALPVDLAYVIFTSGSTGTPKGVQIHQGALSNFLQQSVRRSRFLPDDRVAHQGSPAFDASVGMTWYPLAFGITLVMLDEELLLSPPKFVRWLVDERITRCGMPSSLFEACLQENFAQTRLRSVGTGLEKLHKIEKALPFQLTHGYGPTECTVGASGVFEVTEFPSPIGRPHDNYRIYILDEDLELLPQGALGEAYIAGASVGRGYLRAEATADKFLPDPFGPPGSRMYRTGDVLRWRNDTLLEFKGRVDHQVKIRGYRVEPGEVESALNAHPMVRESIVIPVTSSTHVNQLVAYVAPRPGARLDANVLREAMSERLPKYMVPSAFVVMGALPLTPNGKVDRKALPAPIFGAPSETYVAPATPTEVAIAKVWQEVLAIARIGVNDDFFTLGAHSLHIARVSAGLYAAGLDVTVAQIFKTPTVAALAAFVDAGTHAVAPRIQRAADDAPRLAFVQEVLAGWEKGRAPSATWNSPLRLDIRGPLDGAALRDAVLATLEANDVLRWGYDHEAGLRRLPSSAIPYETHDLTSATPADVDAFCAKQNAVPFVFDGGPLLRFFILRSSSDSHVLLAVWHAFVHDPTHANILADEILARYEAGNGGVPAAPLRYIDYVAWERAWFDGGGAEDVVAARRLLDGAHPIDLADLPRKGGRLATSAGQKWFFADAEAWTRVETISQSLMVTPFMVFVALAGTLLSRWSGSRDITMLVPISLRNIRPELQRMIGRFGNWIPVRLSTDGDPTFRELVARAKTAVIDAHLYETAPSTRVFETDDVYGHPLNRVVLNQPAAAGAAAPSVRSVGSLAVTQRGVPEVACARTELTVALWPAGNGLCGGVRGAEQLFRPETLVEKSEALHAMARNVDADTRLSRL